MIVYELDIYYIIYFDFFNCLVRKILFVINEEMGLGIGKRIWLRLYNKVGVE